MPEVFASLYLVRPLFSRSHFKRPENSPGSDILSPPFSLRIILVLSFVKKVAKPLDKKHRRYIII
jgi:hypothetical protein